MRGLIERQRRNWREVPPVEFAERYARPILVEVVAARDEVHAATGTPMVLRLGLSRTFESEPHYRALAAAGVTSSRSLPTALMKFWLVVRYSG